MLNRSSGLPEALASGKVLLAAFLLSSVVVPGVGGMLSLSKNSSSEARSSSVKRFEPLSLGGLLSSLLVSPLATMSLDLSSLVFAEGVWSLVELSFASAGEVLVVVVVVSAGGGVGSSDDKSSIASSNLSSSDVVDESVGGFRVSEVMPFGARAILSPGVVGAVEAVFSPGAGV